MAVLTPHRFTLQPYAGPKTRTTCPSCDRPRCFTRYLDTVTGDLLPEEFGKCDRETNCGYALSPYTRPVSGPSYATAIEQGERPTYQPLPVSRPRPASPPPVVSIPADVFMASLAAYQHNALARLLQQHLGAGVASEVIARFQLGTSTHWPGACVFWLVDEQQRVRGGQVVLYDSTGHTVKEPQRCTTWAHTALAARARRLGQPTPDWLTAYSASEVPKCPCLFGLPQLLTAPATQPVALVESAKTAMLAAPYFPRFLWMATMGLSYLTPERLAPLRGRRLVLFPDAGALDKWQARAVELRRLGFEVQVSEELERLATEEERAAGLDLADVLLREWPGYPPDWDERTA